MPTLPFQRWASKSQIRTFLGLTALANFQIFQVCQSAKLQIRKFIQEYKILHNSVSKKSSFLNDFFIFMEPKVAMLQRLSSREYCRIYCIDDRAFSPCRMVWLLTPPPPSVSKLSLLLSTLCRRSRFGGGWGRSQILRRGESLVLFKSFNAFCYE